MAEVIVPMTHMVTNVDSLTNREIVTCTTPRRNFKVCMHDNNITPPLGDVALVVPTTHAVSSFRSALQTGMKAKFSGRVRIRRCLELVGAVALVVPTTHAVSSFRSAKLE